MDSTDSFIIKTKTYKDIWSNNLLLYGYKTYKDVCYNNIQLVKILSAILFKLYLQYCKIKKFD